MAKKELNVSLSYREQSDKKKLKICEQVSWPGTNLEKNETHGENLDG